MAARAAVPSVKLASGHAMPLLGLGCWAQMTGSNAVRKALDAGYRQIDTAYMYMNEEEVGKDIQDWIKSGAGKREDIFVTTKLPMVGMSPTGVEKYLKKSLEKLSLDYVDLYLVHAPVGLLPGKHMDDLLPVDEDKKLKLDYATDLIGIWKAMEVAADRGLARTIGVSNFSISQLQKTLAIARIPPAVHQFELHLRYQRPQMMKFCKEKNIVVTSYGSLGSPGRQTDTNSHLTDLNILGLLEDPVVQLVAQNHQVTTAQVLLRYWVQQGVTVIPKSSNKDRIIANGKLFGWELSELETKALKSLDQGNAGKSFLIPKDSMLRCHPEFHDFD